MMSEKSLLEDYVANMEEDIKYHQNKIERLRKEKEAGIELIEMIAPLNVEPKSRSTYGSIKLIYETVEDARKVLSHILAKTPIEKFVKTSRDAGSELKWAYTVEYKGIMLLVEPAEPSKDCVAVKRVSTYTSWVCEKA